MSTEFPIEVQPEALAILKRLVERKGNEGSFVRLGVKGGGCSGFEYVIKLDDQPKPIDINAEIEGVRFAVDAKSAAFLAGARLIATGNLMGGGVAFENPNAQRSCGCGSSFVPKSDG